MGEGKGERSGLPASPPGGSAREQAPASGGAGEGRKREHSRARECSARGSGGRGGRPERPAEGRAEGEVYRLEAHRPDLSRVRFRSNQSARAELAG